MKLFAVNSIKEKLSRKPAQIEGKENLPGLSHFLFWIPCLCYTTSHASGLTTVIFLDNITPKSYRKLTEWAGIEKIGVPVR